MNRDAVLKGLEAYPAQREILLRLEELLLADERIEGVALRGLVAEGRSDHYSELDLLVTVRDEAFDQVVAEPESFFQQAGQLSYWFLSARGESRLFAAVFEGMLEVDVAYLRASALQAQPGERYWVVLKDRSGWLAVVAEESAKLSPPAPPRVDRPDDRFWLWVYRTMASVDRGDLWYAWAMLNGIRQLLMQLIAEADGHPLVSLKQYHRRIDRTDERWLAATVCSLQPKAILQALSAATGLYVSLRARRGVEPAKLQAETHIRRILQTLLVRTH